MDYRKLIKGKKLSVTLKKDPVKGVGLYAREKILKGDIIAFYKIKVFLLKDYETDGVYSFEVYRKNGDEYKRLIGDIYEESFPEPIDGIPFWAPFANEPNKGQRTNAMIDIDLKGNFVGKTYLSPGDILIYKLVATKMIKPGSEILWYYGPDYSRNYSVSKK